MILIDVKAFFSFFTPNDYLRYVAPIDKMKDIPFAYRTTFFVTATMLLIFCMQVKTGF